MGDDALLTIMDVRHVRRDENVHCSGDPGCNAWASHYMEAQIDPRIIGRADYQVYLCRRHLQRTLALADSLNLT
jgi:hypothetical protein